MPALFVTVDGADAGRRLQLAAQSIGDATGLFRAVAGALEHETEANFGAQGRPSWVPLAKSTERARLARNNGSTVLKILQDSGILAASISSDFGPSHAMIGAGGAASAYAAVHQYGDTIERPAHSVKVRLRTDAKGALVGQESNANLARFAKDSHKRVRETWATVDAYRVDIPARPYLPFSGPVGQERLQPTAEGSLLALLEEHLLRPFA